MKNTKTIIIPAFLLVVAFSSFQTASANADSNSHKFALLGPTTVLSNIELKNNTELEIHGRSNLGDSDAHINSKSDFEASSSMHRDNEERREETKSNSNYNSKGEFETKSNGNVERGNNSNRPWFSWFGRIFGQSRSNETIHASTTGSTNTDSHLPVIYKKIRFITSSSSTTVSWNTDVQTYGEVRFATSSASGTLGTLILDNNLSTSHTVTLTGMNLGTEYYVSIIAKDASGKVTTSETVKYTAKDGSTNITINESLFMRLWHSIFG
ncbi:MAG: hypothetical protein K9M11_02970 [Candidatus Pacebacteria bacterium]|nr:hypothetical protein [Candidatus Paceibacterota bacterium]